MSFQNWFTLIFSCWSKLCIWFFTMLKWTKFLSEAYYLSRITIRSGITKLVMRKFAQVVEYSQHPVFWIFVTSNFQYVELFLCELRPYNFFRYHKPYFLEFWLCQTIISVPSSLFRSVFHPLSRTFSFHSFEYWKDTFANFDQMFIFSHFDTKAYQ